MEQEHLSKDIIEEIKHSEGDKLSELRAMNSDEVSIQHDWEIWLKEKKTILACRANHDTGLHIQQDFTSTIANENDFDIEKYSNRKHPLDDKVPDNADNEIP
ncbi:12178_t:CDS:2, partial [Rhizophagus irregularis]